MKNIFINFLYWFVSTIQLILLKIITHTYLIDNIIFNSFFRAITLPYYVYKLIKINKPNNKVLVARWYDIINGILDQFDIILTYIAFSGLTIGEYITLRTFSVFFGSIFLMIYYKKILSLQKIISIGLILLAGMILLGFYNNSGFFYYIICLLSSFAYSLISFIIEIYVKTDEDRNLNFYWTKTVSNIIAIFIAIVNEFNYKTIITLLNNYITRDIIIIIILEIIISVLENYYYYFKIKLISLYPKNGSIITQFLDIMRRFALIIIGIIFFSEIYTSIILLSVGFMFIGSVIGVIDYNYLLYSYEKYLKKKPQKIITLPDIEIICIEK